MGSPGPREQIQEKDDVFFTSVEGIENHVEIKTPKPNYDQARSSKRRILRIHAVRHAAGVNQLEVFVGMPYNPNGLLGEYQWPTTKYFLDLGRDIKVGREFWNHIGNSADTYDEILECFMTVASNRRSELVARPGGV